jgi:hypothetical protein
MKIKPTIIFSFLASFLIFSAIILFYQYEIKDGNLISRSNDLITPHEFYTQNFNPDQKRIFIIGSSQVVGINAIYVQNYIESHGFDNYDVYNLAVISDMPINRLNTVDKIISAKPSMILYGISDRDFSFVPQSSVNNPLPDPHSFFNFLLNQLKQMSPIDLEIFEFPQRTTLQMIINFVSFLRGDSLESIPYPNTPFMRVTEGALKINHELDYRKSGFESIPLPEENVNLIALKKIIQKLDANEIEVIIFVAPANKFYSEFMPINYKNSFNLILDDLNKASKFKVQNLFYKYKDLDIWGDLTHVAINLHSNIYSDDVSKIILENFDK